MVMIPPTPIEPPVELPRPPPVCPSKVAPLPHASRAETAPNGDQTDRQAYLAMLPLVESLRSSVVDGLAR
jgi:hypothetical protein